MSYRYHYIDMNERSCAAWQGRRSFILDSSRAEHGKQLVDGSRRRASERARVNESLPALGVGLANIVARRAKATLLPSVEQPEGFAVGFHTDAEAALAQAEVVAALGILVAGGRTLVEHRTRARGDAGRGLLLTHLVLRGALASRTVCARRNRIWERRARTLARTAATRRTVGTPQGTAGSQEEGWRHRKHVPQS
jgi:hypothetical protein